MLKLSNRVAALVVCSLLSSLVAAQGRAGGAEGRSGAKPSPSSFNSNMSANETPYRPPAGPQQPRPAAAAPHSVAPLAVRAPQPAQPTLQQLQTAAAVAKPAAPAPRPAPVVSEPVIQAPAVPAAPLPVADAAGLFAVDYRDGLLSVVADKAELGKLLNMVGSKTGASIEVAPEIAGEPVVAHLGPGSPRQVLSQLLDSPHLAYIVMGSDEDGSLQRIVIRKRNSFGRQTVAAMRAPVPTPEPVQETQPVQEQTQAPEQPQSPAAEQANPPQN